LRSRRDCAQSLPFANGYESQDRIVEAAGDVAALGQFSSVPVMSIRGPYDQREPFSERGVRNMLVKDLMATGFTNGESARIRFGTRLATYEAERAISRIVSSCSPGAMNESNMNSTTTGSAALA
jgi:hypothetical protein